MQDFLKLKEIDIKEIQKVTKITPTKLKIILEKDFQNIDRSRAVGFIRIIEREFKLNLSDWLEEYNRFYNFEIKKTNKNEIQTPEIKGQEIKLEEIKLDAEKKKLNSLDEDNKKSQSYKKNKEQIEIQQIKVTQTHNKYNYEPKNKNKILVSNTSKGNNKIKIVGIIAILILLSIIIGITYFVSNLEVQQNEKLTIETQNNTQVQMEESTLHEEKPIEEIIIDKNVEPKVPEIEHHNILIKPNSELWFGYVDLSNFKKNQVQISSPYSLDTTSNIAFFFGHGDFSIEIDGVISNFNIATPVRFIFDGKEFKKITLKDFKTITNGASW